MHAACLRICLNQRIAGCGMISQRDIKLGAGQSLVLGKRFLQGAVFFSQRVINLFFIRRIAAYNSQLLFIDLVLLELLLHHHLSLLI